VRTILGYAFEGIGVAALVLLYIELCRHCWKDAHKRGYAAGWKACEEFIVKLESDVDQERQKIWREEV